METSNNLKFTTSRTVGNTRYKVKIRLNDECRNGHEDFAATVDIYENGQDVGGGADHETIRKFFPELSIFCDLHLSDWNGYPMYCVENGFYHLNSGKDEVVKDYLRIDDETLKKLKQFNSRSQTEFAFALEELKLRPKMEKEAKKAIKKLEELTGMKFESKATRNNWPTLTETELADMKHKQETGYFTPEAVAARDKAANDAARKAKIEKIEKEFADDVEKALNKKLVALYLAERDIDESNVIHYDHRNTLSFNYTEAQFATYKKKWTENEFHDFVKNYEANPVGLPEGIQFELKRTY